MPFIVFILLISLFSFFSLSAQDFYFTKPTKNQEGYTLYRVMERGSTWRVLQYNLAKESDKKTNRRLEGRLIRLRSADSEEVVDPQEFEARMIPAQVFSYQGELSVLRPAKSLRLDLVAENFEGKKLVFDEVLKQQLRPWRRGEKNRVTLSLSERLKIRDQIEAELLSDIQRSTDHRNQKSLSASAFITYLQKTFSAKRAERLVIHRTLFGEFRGHLSLAHLFWTFRAMENRALHPAFSPSISDRFGKLSQWMPDTLLAAALESEQFSCWNSDDPNCKALLELNDHEASDQIARFIANNEAGLIGIQGTAPEITHYYSPSARPKNIFGNPKPPDWTKNSCMRKLNLPGVFTDEDPTDLSLVDSDYFVGFLERKPCE
jgi:hypothetical protein